jgi:hypothetical protein
MVNPLLALPLVLFQEIVQKWIDRIGFIGLDNSITNKQERAEFLNKIKGCAIQIFDYGRQDTYCYRLSTDEEKLKFRSFNHIAFEYILKRNIFCRDIWIICWDEYLSEYFQNEEAYDCLENISINICCNECEIRFNDPWFNFTSGLIKIIHERIYGAGRTLSSLREIIDCDLQFKQLILYFPRIVSINVNFLYDRGVYLNSHPHLNLNKFVFYQSIDKKKWELQVNDYPYFQNGFVSGGF